MNIVIVDENWFVRKGLKEILSVEPNIELVGEASSIKEGVEKIINLKPDIVIIDLKVGKESGLEVIKNVKAIGVNCKFIVLTTSSDNKKFRMAEELGVEGYLLKDIPPEEVIYAIRIISTGRRFYDANLMATAIINEKNDLCNNGTIHKLTKREKEILISLGKGYSNNEIANMLCITESTVKKHVSNVLVKLSLADRTQAALYVTLNGLINNQ